MLKRNKGLSRKTQIVRRQPIKRSKVKIKNRSFDPDYPVIRQQFLNDNPICFTQELWENNREAFSVEAALVKMVMACELKAITVHHSEGRHGANLNDRSKFRGLCALCHQYIQDHSENGRLLGYYSFP